MSLLLSLLGWAHTDKMDKSKFPHSISEFRKLKLGNFNQTILIRGRNISSPMILFIHGGPGMSEMAELNALSPALEDKFTIVAWDQRGCGKSYARNVPDMSHQQIIEDGAELIAYLREHFKKNKVYLVGHSWGTVLSLELAQKIPEQIEAVINLGQVVNFARDEQLGYDFALDLARKNHDSKSVRALERIGKPMQGLYPHRVTDLIRQRKILMKVGGVFYDPRKVKYLILLILRSPVYTLSEKWHLGRGRNEILKAIWNEQLMKIDLTKSMPKVPVPIYFFHGKMDGITSLSLVEEYYHLLNAPVKKLVVFEKSGHDPRIDEPEKFIENLLDCFQ